MVKTLLNNRLRSLVSRFSLDYLTLSNTLDFLILIFTFNFLTFGNYIKSLITLRTIVLVIGRGSKEYLLFYSSEITTGEVLVLAIFKDVAIFIRVFVIIEILGFTYFQGKSFLNNNNIDR